MRKIDYLKSSFDNIQELIRFTDQKIATVLVVCGIEITVFFDLSKNFTVSVCNNTFIQISSFIVGVIFVLLNLIIMYLCIIKVLRPRFANHYSSKDYSIMYFEHIALNTKQMLKDEVYELDKERQVNELSDQLFEISKILYDKNRNCSVIFYMVFINIISLLVYVLLISMSG
jgi:hypothetical protein